MNPPSLDTKVGRVMMGEGEVPETESSPQRSHGVAISMSSHQRSQYAHRFLPYVFLTRSEAMK